MYRPKKEIKDLTVEEFAIYAYRVGLELGDMVKKAKERNNGQLTDKDWDNIRKEYLQYLEDQGTWNLANSKDW